MSDLFQLIQFFGAEGGHAAEAAHEEAAGIAALGIDPLAILAQAGTFLLLFFIVKKFALEKIVASLEQRRKTIDDGVRLGHKMEQQQAQLDERVEQVLKEARAEADKVIASSRQEAGSIIKQAEVTASAKAEQMLADAEAHISEEIAAARKGLEKEILSLVAETTEVILREKLDAKKDAQLLERALAEVAGAK